MKQTATICGSLMLFLIALMLLFSATTASSQTSTTPNIPHGAALYDNWIAASGQQAPAGNDPMWSRQTTNTLSGPDTWRCITCHGWDYQGKDGAYRSGTNYTGFPGVLANAQTLSITDITDILSGKSDAAHDFSKYIDAAGLNDLASFIKTAAINDNQFIDPLTYDVIGGDAAHGKTLFESACATCHGEDGAKIVMSFEGVQAGLGTLASIDPWRFLHKTRFGTPGTPMVIGYTLGWSPQDGRDVLLYAQQTFKTGLEKPTTLPVIPGDTTPAGTAGGPAQNWFTGILTAIGAVMASAGFAVLLGAVLVIIIFIVVWSMRNNK
jgi:mono/diheme cytochrome c family protein